MPGGVEVGRGWGALYADPAPTQRYTADHTLMQGRSCNVGAPTTNQAMSCVPGFYLEHDVDEEELFYENFELEQSDSEDEEDGPKEVQVLGGFIRPPTVPNPTSIKHKFREETWSQSTNEYAQGALPYVGDPPGVKKLIGGCHLFCIFLGFFGLGKCYKIYVSRLTDMRGWFMKGRQKVVMIGTMYKRRICKFFWQFPFTRI